MAAKQPRIEVYQSVANGNWHWRLVATNGLIVGDGSEGYATKANAKRAARTMQTAAARAVIVDALEHA